MKILISQLLEDNDIDDFTNFLVYQSIRSTITLINQNIFEIQIHSLEYLEWLLSNTQRVLNLNIIHIQPLITSTIRKLIKNQPSINDMLLNLLNILKNMSDQNNIQEMKNKNIRTLQEDIIDFISPHNEYADIVQSLQHLKLKVRIIFIL